MRVLRDCKHIKYTPHIHITAATSLNIIQLKEDDKITLNKHWFCIYPANPQRFQKIAESYAELVWQTLQQPCSNV